MRMPARHAVDAFVTGVGAADGGAGAAAGGAPAPQPPATLTRSAGVPSWVTVTTYPPPAPHTSMRRPPGTSDWVTLRAADACGPVAMRVARRVARLRWWNSSAGPGVFAP